ncbi:MAG: hypothetical protein ACI9KE_000310 [Polyangiales bacterium]|jgi:hypothetical protein
MHSPSFTVIAIALCMACGDDPVTLREDVGAASQDASRAYADVTEADAGSDANVLADVPGTGLDVGVEPDAFAPEPDAGPMGPVDEIDFSTLIWLYPDISGWEITSELNVSFSGSSICLEYDKKDEWPIVQAFGTTDVVANAWVFAQSSGQWYAATFEWMRPGQTCKAQAAVEGGHIKRNPFEAEGWTPESGEELYFMVSGLIRNPSYSNVMERTNIVRATWP